jgi:hypothetical protein
VVKLHLLLDHQGYLPQFMVITASKTQEIEVARRLRYDARFQVLEIRLRSPFDYFAGALPGSDSMSGSGSIILRRPSAWLRKGESFP